MVFVSSFLLVVLFWGRGLLYFKRSFVPRPPAIFIFFRASKKIKDLRLSGAAHGHWHIIMHFFIQHLWKTKATVKNNMVIALGLTELLAIHEIYTFYITKA
jgi:hypothetical protein